MGLGEPLKRGVLTRSALHCLTFASLFLKTYFIEITHTHTHTQELPEHQKGRSTDQEGTGREQSSQSVVLEPIPGDPTLT